MPRELNVRSAGALLLCSVLAGCAVAGAGDGNRKPAVSIDGITIRNGLAYPVTDVMVQVPATGGFAGCGYLLPRSECSNAFGQLDWRSNAVVVSWREHGRPHTTDEFVIEVPEGLHPGRTARIEVIIHSPGQAGARLIQP